MILCLYALSDHKKRIAGVKWIEVNGLFIAAAPCEVVPEPTPANLRAHDDMVRRVGDTVLPFRFGTTVEDASQLGPLLEPKHDAFAGALVRIRGCDQMTIRVFGAAAPAALPDDDAALGPGARYLHARRAALAMPEIEPLRAAVAPFVRAEIVERAAPGSALLGSVYQLVLRDRAERWARALRRAKRDLPDLRIETSGPWPPYAFCP